MGGKMKFRRVMVVAPIRSRMAPKSGKERASSTIRAMTESLKTTLVRLNSARLIHFKHPHSTFFPETIQTITETEGQNDPDADLHSRDLKTSVCSSYIYVCTSMPISSI